MKTEQNGIARTDVTTTYDLDAMLDEDLKLDVLMRAYSIQDVCRSFWKRWRQHYESTTGDRWSPTTANVESAFMMFCEHNLPVGVHAAMVAFSKSPENGHDFSAFKIYARRLYKNTMSASIVSGSRYMAGVIDKWLK